MSEDKGSFKGQMRREVLGKMVSNAFFGWESAVIIALTILLTFLNVHPFGWWQQWFWVVAGMLAELALIGVSLSDPENLRKAVADQFRQKFAPADIRNSRSRQRLEKALEYRARMEELVRSQSGAMRVNLQQAADEMDKGVRLMYSLGRRLDTFMDNQLIKRDIQTVPRAIQAMEIRLKKEKDERVRAELLRTLDTKQAQLDNLQQLENTMKRADIQIDNMLAAMGTLYAQMQLIDAKDLDSGRVQRLRQDVAAQVLEMQDTITAMDEVYQQSSTS
jgi:hypothetical protein